MEQVFIRIGLINAPPNLHHPIQNGMWVGVAALCKWNYHAGKQQQATGIVVLTPHTI